MRLVPPPPPLRPKALLRQREGGEERNGRLNAALHKTRPHQGERPRPRRERRWLWPAAPPRGSWVKSLRAPEEKTARRAPPSSPAITASLRSRQSHAGLFDEGVPTVPAINCCRTATATPLVGIADSRRMASATAMLVFFGTKSPPHRRHG